MHLKAFLVAIATLAMTVEASLSRAEPGLLVMRVAGVEIGNTGRPIGGVYLTSYALMNVDTKEIVRWPSTGRVLVTEAEESIYCLFSVSPYWNMRVQYCGEPYFRVAAGKINNAGRWRFGISFADRSSKLLSSIEDLDDTLTEASVYDKALLDRYGQAPKP